MEKIFKREDLTSMELEFVIGQLLLLDNEVERHIVKYALLAQLLFTDEAIKEYGLIAEDEMDKSCNYIYDKLVEHNVLDNIECTHAILIVDEVFDKTRSTSNILEGFLSGFENKLDEYTKTLDLEMLKKALDDDKK